MENERLYFRTLYVCVCVCVCVCVFILFAFDWFLIRNKLCDEFLLEISPC